IPHPPAKNTGRVGHPRHTTSSATPCGTCLIRDHGLRPRYKEFAHKTSNPLTAEIAEFAEKPWTLCHPERSEGSAGFFSPWDLNLTSCSSDLPTPRSICLIPMALETIPSIFEHVHFSLDTTHGALHIMNMFKKEGS